MLMAASLHAADAPSATTGDGARAGEAAQAEAADPIACAARMLDTSSACFDQGDIADALRGYRAAIELLLRSEVPQHLSDARWLQLSRAHRRVAGALAQQGDLNGATASSELSVAATSQIGDATLRDRGCILSSALAARFQRFAGNAPAALTHQRNCAQAWLRHVARAGNDSPTSLEYCAEQVARLAEDAKCAGENDEALAAARSAAGLLDRVAQREPATSQRLYLAGFVRSLIGEVLEDRGDLDGALTEYRLQLAAAERRVELDPASSAQRDLAMAHNHLGGIAAARGDLVGARASYQRSLDIRTALLAAEPNKARWRRDLAICQERMGDVLERSGDAKGALELFESMLATRRSLADNSPGDAQLQQELANAYSRIAKLRSEERDRQGALASHQAALAAARRALALEPAHVDCRSAVATALRHVGSVQRELGEYGAAVANLREAVRILEEIAERDRSNVRLRRELHTARTHLGYALVRSGDITAGIDLYGGVLTEREALLRASPNDPKAQADVAGSLLSIGYAEKQRGDIDAAFTAYRRAWPLYARLAEAFPDDAQHADNVRNLRANVHDAACVLRQRIESMQDPDARLRALRALRAKIPEDSGTACHLGRELLLSGDVSLRDPPAGLVLIEEALAREPRNIHYLESLALAHHLLQHHVEALDAQRRLIACLPDSTSAADRARHEQALDRYSNIQRATAAEPAGVEAATPAGARQR